MNNLGIIFCETWSMFEKTTNLQFMAQALTYYNKHLLFTFT